VLNAIIGHAACLTTKRARRESSLQKLAPHFSARRQESSIRLLRWPFDDPGDDVCQVGLRFDADKLAGLDERSDDESVFSA
jgi:hypothetical protein